jgi:hypothetical protein
VLVGPYVSSLEALSMKFCTAYLLLLDEISLCLLLLDEITLCLLLLDEITFCPYWFTITDTSERKKVRDKAEGRKEREKIMRN